MPRALAGDKDALAALFRRNRERLRRIVAVRLAVRLARILEDEVRAEEELRAAFLAAGDPAAGDEAGLLRWMAEWLERETRRRAMRPGDEARERPRTLRIDARDPDEEARRRRADLERVLDARVAELEPDELREVLLLRDYCGASWELVRARLGLLSEEAAQELYRRAHHRLACGVRAGSKRA